MSSGLEAPPVAASTQQQRHTAKSLLWFELWSRVPSVTCVDACAGRAMRNRHRHAVDDSHGSSHLGNLPGVPLAHGVVVAHAGDLVAELEAAGHRRVAGSSSVRIQLESSFWPSDGITQRGRGQGCRSACAGPT